MSGVVRKLRQRWLCKECGCNFVEGDKRKEKTAPALQSIATLLACVGLSFRLVGRLFGVSHVSVQNWFDSFCNQLPGLSYGDYPVEMVELDEMRTFVDSKKTNYGLTKQPPVLLAVFDYWVSKWVVVTLPPLSK
jgi:hypothetical protein